MKAITLYEPWASLMAIGAKQNETRPMRTAHRGDICIHAAIKTVDGITQDCLNAFRNRGVPVQWHFGCIVAVVEIWDVQPSEQFLVEDSETARLNPGNRIVISSEEFRFGNYSPGRFIYCTRNLRRLRDPVPAKGMQCVGWTLPPDVEAKVRAQL